MDGNIDWSASALFSPSKARAQQAQAKDWASVESWLAKKYASKRLPPFERNEETLQALLTLASFNEDMDEQKALVDRVEKAALQASVKKLSRSDSETFRQILAQLQSQNTLLALTEAIVDLDATGASLSSLATSVVDLTTLHFEKSQEATRAESQVYALKHRQVQLQATLLALKDDKFRASPDLPQQTAEWIKNTKHLRAKVAEYTERIGAHPSLRDDDAITEVVLRQKLALQNLNIKIIELTSQLDAYAALPVEPKAAYETVLRSKKTLRTLVQQRDGIFTSLV